MPLYEGPVLDAHHHIIWDWETNYPWLNRPMRPMIFGDDWSGMKKDYLIGDLLTDFATHDVKKSVHVQANFDMSRPVDETSGLQGFADETGFPQGIVAYADLTDPNLETILDAHMAYPNTCGIRQQVYWHPGNEYWRYVERQDFCLSTSFRRGLAMLGDRNLTFDFQGYPQQFADLAMLARENQDVRFCLVHAGMLTSLDAGKVDEWRDALRALLPLDNIWIKVSGLNTYSRKLDEPMMDLVSNTVLDMFGPDRCFFGSNFPVEGMWTSFDAYTATQKKVLADRSEVENEKFFWSTAEAFYRI